MEYPSHWGRSSSDYIHHRKYCAYTLVFRSLSASLDETLLSLSPSQSSQRAENVLIRSLLRRDSSSLLPSAHIIGTSSSFALLGVNNKCKKKLSGSPRSGDPTRLSSNRRDGWKATQRKVKGWVLTQICRFPPAIPIFNSSILVHFCVGSRFLVVLVYASGKQATQSLRRRY